MQNFGRVQPAALGGVHRDKYKSGEEAAKNAIKRLRDPWSYGVRTWQWSIIEHLHLFNPIKACDRIDSAFLLGTLYAITLDI